MITNVLSLLLVMSEELAQQTEELSLDSKTVFDSKEEFNAKHPLNSRWTLWYTKPQTNKSENWHDLLKPVITFSSVEEFWGIYNSIPQANQLPLKSDYHLFKEGIRPEWEDEANSKGGKWQFSFNKKLEVNPIINDLWLRGLLAVIGETIEDDENEVNGIVLNIRKQAYRVGIWTKDCDESKLKTVGERLKKVLQLKDEQKVEFMSHDASNTRGAEPQILKSIESLFYIYTTHTKPFSSFRLPVSTITHNMNTYKLIYIYNINIKSNQNLEVSIYSKCSKTQLDLLYF